MPERVLESELEQRGDYEVFYRDGQPFTGVYYRLDAEGRLEAEGECVDGVLWGHLRTWFPSGMPEYDNRFWRGLPHGLCRQWHKNGQLAVERRCELGNAIRRRKWDPDGNLVEEYEIQEGSENYVVLQAFRESYAGHNPPPPDFEETPPPPRPDPP